MYIIDLKDRTVAEFTKKEITNFVNTTWNTKRFFITENRPSAVKIIKKLIKKGF